MNKILLNKFHVGGTILAWIIWIIMVGNSGGRVCGIGVPCPQPSFTETLFGNFSQPSFWIISIIGTIILWSLISLVSYFILKRK